MTKLHSKIIVSERGTLNEFDFKNFDIQRIFIVSSVPSGSIRGYHAHEKTKQFLCCVEGCLEITLDDGVNRKTFLLKKSEYLYQDPMIWAEIKFINKDSRLLTACSTKHDESDYIRDYDKFLEKARDNAG